MGKLKRRRPNDGTLSLDKTLGWRITLNNIGPYLSRTDLVHLMFTSKDFLLSTYHDYPKQVDKHYSYGLLFDLFLYLEEDSQVTPKQMLWFINTLYKCDKSYIQQNLALHAYFSNDFMYSNVTWSNVVWNILLQVCNFTTQDKEGNTPVHILMMQYDIPIDEDDGDDCPENTDMAEYRMIKKIPNSVWNSTCNIQNMNGRTFVHIMLRYMTDRCVLAVFRKINRKQFELLTDNYGYNYDMLLDKRYYFFTKFINFDKY